MSKLQKKAKRLLKRGLGMKCVSQGRDYLIDEGYTDYNEFISFFMTVTTSNKDITRSIKVIYLYEITGEFHVAFLFYTDSRNHSRLNTSDCAMKIEDVEIMANARGFTIPKPLEMVTAEDIHPICYKGE